MRDTLGSRAWWAGLTGGSVNRRIFGAGLTILAATLAVKGVTFLKEVVTAAAFGSGDAADALVIALLTPTFVVNVVSGSLGAALVPQFVDVREREGAAAAAGLLARTVRRVTVGLLALAVGLAVAAPWYLRLVAAGFSEPKRALAAELTWWLVPMVVASGARTLWAAALTAGERFWQASVSAAVSPALTVAAVLALPALGVRNVAIALGVGGIIEAAWLGVTLRRGGLPLGTVAAATSHETLRLVRQWVPIMAGSVLMASSTLIDQSMAAALLPGSVARLEYGSRLVAVVTSLGTGALGVAVVPYFALLASKRDMAALSHTARLWVRATFLASLPVVAVLAGLATPVVRAIYERGSFSPADTSAVAAVQAGLALQIPFYIAGIVLVRLVAALEAAQALTWISLVNTLLNAALNLILIRYLGLPGIALATSVMYAASFTMLAVYVTRRHGLRVL